jgi:hypothetical protein
MAVKGERQPLNRCILMAPRRPGPSQQNGPTQCAFGRTASCIKMRNEPTMLQAGPNFSMDPGGTSGFGSESANGNCTLADRCEPAKAGRGH